MMTNDDWKMDWVCFVKKIEILLNQGFNSAQISEIFADTEVKWKGKIKTKDLSRNPSVKMEMIAVDVCVPHEVHGRVDYLNLNVGDVTKWQDVADGSIIQFVTTLSRGNVVFPGIRWCDLGNNFGYLAISTSNSLPL